MKYSYIQNGLSRFIATLILAFVAVGCTDEVPEVVNRPTGVGDSFTVTGSMAVPDMIRVISRGTLSKQPNDGLILTVFEFDLGEDAENSFLSNIYTADLLEDTGVENESIVRFNLTLKSSNKPKALHFMLADKPLTATNGSVASILSTLTVGEKEDDGGEPWEDEDMDMQFLAKSYVSAMSDGWDDDEIYSNDSEAYWGYVEFPEGYVKTAADGKPVLDNAGNMIMRDDVVTLLQRIPVIRNFAQISVEVAEDVDNFRLRGFDIVNVPTSGTVGPWDTSKQQVPQLLTESGSMMKYSKMDYNGIVPGGAKFRNQEPLAEALWDEDYLDGKLAPRYMYEHPYESTRPSYLILFGDYRWRDAVTGEMKEEPCFYRIDIGKADTENNIFRYYNIIRNIRYNVVISKVDAKGCSTVEEAIEHVPFNNISASTKTSEMLNISDGHNLLLVRNKLNYIIVNPDETIEVLYRYIEDVTKRKEERNDIPMVVGLTEGDVVQSYTESVSTTIDGVNWKKFTIKTNNPTSITKEQSFSIVDGRGLGRTINITLREPWRYPAIGNLPNGEPYYATVARGSKSLYDLKPPVPISSKRGEEFTVYFNLPKKLNKAMFPLDFYLESKAQGIENNKKGTLIVTTGPSLFDPSVTAISYLKRVSYEEYLYKYNDDLKGLDVGEENINHTIRCRFKTIIDAELSDAEIRIHSSYFSPDISAKFERVSSISPDPQ